ncbi:MBL fold metallo-hydrolase [Kangiella sediminilitoris]|uniref:Beta-lactamase n=1 Tax=Kangiella sediminilitoris TaxID=1144748 RepID=A0A1B3BB99_9GAMM|nr:MBL fold metallo-hydrolase [Kangiella sediminilitoris]AOE50064.1 beta-lactamase [Kangiella sediminilitoris]
MLRVASLGSGSKGNSTIIATKEATVMVDCGFTLKETTRRLERLGVPPTSLDAILVTHEHQDHISGVGPLSRKFNIPVWSTRGSLLSGKCGNLKSYSIIEGFESFDILDLSVTPLSVPHDAREPCQYLFKAHNKQLAVLTDLGSYTPELVEALKNSHGLLLECNHDEDMLWNGPYPRSLKQRVGGPLGHMSNRQAIELLKQVFSDNLQLLIASHISEQNNCPKLVRERVAESINWPQENIIIAEQNDGFEWFELS